MDNVQDNSSITMYQEEFVVPFEADYENIKLNSNLIWEKYEEKIMKLVKGLSWWKNFDKDELTQQSYLYFVSLCDIYDPYYMGHFFPFNRFLFKNLIIKLRAYIQRYYFKLKREKPAEFCEFLTKDNFKNNVLEADSKMYGEYIYSLITERQKQILELTMKGYKQQEIGSILKISQSRVSVIKKKTLTRLFEVLDETKTLDEKKAKQIQELKDYIFGK